VSLTVQQMEDRGVRWHSRAMLYVALAMIPLFAENVVHHRQHAMSLIIMKGVWGLVLLIASVLFPRVAAKTRGGLLCFVAIVSAATLSALAFVRGGGQVSAFPWQIMVPLGLLLLVKDHVPAAITGAVTTLLAAVTILVVSDAAPANYVNWLSLISLSGGLAVLASTRLRVQTREECTQNRERLDALARLAESERLRFKAERMALVGQLAGGVAHEINNPLGFAISNLDFLAGELAAFGAQAGEASEVIAETQSGLLRIKEIVKDLTAYSRDGTEEANEVNLHAVLHEAERMASLRTTGRVAVRNELPADLRPVLGNAQHLAKVFSHLLVNAADAVGTARADGTIWIRATQAADGLSIEVDDNGPGLSDAVMEGLFQPFFTTKGPGKGTGLGLATSREYLRRAGGDLQAIARPGGGARFQLALRWAA
jgi:two-component system, NtrC family, sensor kinase